MCIIGRQGSYFTGGGGVGGFGTLKSKSENKYKLEKRHSVVVLVVRWVRRVYTFTSLSSGSRDKVMALRISSTSAGPKNLHITKYEQRPLSPISILVTSRFFKS